MFVYFVVSAAVILLSWPVARLVLPLLPIQQVEGLASWITFFYHSEKQQVLLQYALCLTGLFLIFLVALVRQRTPSIGVESAQGSSRRSSVLIWVTGVCSAVLVAWIFSSFLARPVQVFSEYPFIQETTVLTSGTMTNEEFMRGTKGTPVAAEFFWKNELNVPWQTLNRGIIHHHHFVFGPIQQYSLGRPIREINMQYGFLNVWGFGHLLKWMGGINYENYFRAFFAFYPIYYIGLFFLLVLLLGQWSLVLGGMAGALAAVMGCNFIVILMAPGLNPIRHFFDLFVILFLFLFLKKPDFRHLVGVGVSCLLAIANNVQMGLLLSLAAAATLFIYILKQDCSRKRIYLGLAGLACAMVIVLAAFRFFSSLGIDLLGPYYFKGLLSFPIKMYRFYILLAMIGGGYVALLLAWRRTGNFKFITLFLFLYSQALLIYAVWGSTVPHLYNFAAIYVFSGFAFVKMIGEALSGPRASTLRKALYAVPVIIALVFCYFAVKRFDYGRAVYSGIFSTHKVFDWKTPIARFRSTMDPRPFEESVALIQKYSSKKAVHIISKYENILLPLSERYSALPLLELSWFMMSSREWNVVLGHFRGDAPEFVFVDRDVDRDLSGTVIPLTEPLIGAWLHQESVWRADRYRDLSKLFGVIKNDYVLVEQRGFLSVYRRVAKSPNSLPSQLLMTGST